MNQQTASGTQYGAAGNLLNQLMLAGRLVFDGRVPLVLKLLLPVAALVYWLWPVDLMPFLPFDDIAVMVVALHFFVKLASEAVNKQQAGPAQSSQTDNNNVVDTTWRVVE